MSTNAERTKHLKIAKPAAEWPSPRARATDPASRAQRVETATAVPPARRDPRLLSPRDISLLQRTVGNRAVGVLLAARGSTGPSLIQPELTHTLQQSSGVHRTSRIQRVADPNTAPDVVRVIKSGTANYGVYILQDGSETVAVKFSKEDTRRAAFADKVLEAAGVANTNAVSQRDGGTIIANITRIAQTYEATGTDAQKAIATQIKANIALASKATSVLVMDKAEGTDFHDVMDDPTSDKAFLTSPTFHAQLGRLAAADALLGNSDRFSAVMRGKSEWAILNPANFKVTAQGIINTLDNDTQTVGVKLLRHVGSKTTPEEWAKFLIRGGTQHTPQNDKKTGKPSVESQGQRITPNLEALFDASKRQLFYEELKASAKGYKVAFTTDFATFDQSFNAGIQHALTGMVQQLDTLRAEAVKVGGSDAGAGFIDPEALEHKGNYLKERMAGSSAAEAHSMMAFRMQAQAVLHFKSEFRQVSKVPLEADNLTKAMRAFTPNTKIDKFAEKLKKQARHPGAQAEDLKQGEETLRGMIQGEKSPDRRVYKALFEAKFARLKLYLQESDGALDEMIGAGQGPSTKGAWLSQFQFRAKLENTYKSALQVWHTKLNAIDEAAQSAILATLEQSLVDKAALMEKTL